MKSSFASGSTRLPRAVEYAAILGLLLPGGLGAQGRIEGQVINGTTNRPVPNQQVRLLLPRGGMQEVATASTDANGDFVFRQQDIDPSLFYLLEAQFQQVPYHVPAQFDSAGMAKLTLTVYGSTRSDAGVRIQSLRVLIRAEGDKVRVQEEYAVLNPNKPPLTFADPAGTFRFHLSSSAKDVVMAVAGLMNMPIPQTPEPGKSPGEYSIHYALKPGVTTVTLAFNADYSSRELALSQRVSYPVDRTEVYASPASLSISSPLLNPTGVDTRNDSKKFEARNLSRGATLEVQLAGEPATSVQTENEQAGPEVKIVPNSMSQLAGPLLLCFLLVLMWALGIRVAKEWPQWQERHSRSPAHKQLEAKLDTLLNSLADLDELFAAGTMPKNKYWKARLELKAKLAAVLKNAPPLLLESYAIRHSGP